MKKWDETSEDDLLNYNDADTGQMAQYDRIMSYKLRYSINLLRETFIKQTDDLKSSIDSFNKTSARLSSILCWLNFILVVLTIILVYFGIKQ